MMEYRNAQYTADSRIDCEVNHPKFGWIPFTADPNDPEKHGRELFSHIEKSGKAKPYIAPPEPTAEELLEAARNVAKIDRVSFLLGMIHLRVITEAAALESADGTWPASFDTFLDSMTLAEKMTVKSAWRAADRVGYRSLILETITKWSQTEEKVATLTQTDLDNLFRVSV